jgi:ribosomal protein S18 acetylase RimI-like enzyme
MNIRNANFDDVEAISVIASSLTAKYVVAEFPETARTGLLASMSVEGIAKHMQSGCRYHVAESEGRVIGAVGVTNNQHLYHLFVDEAHQHQGIAKALWRVAMGACIAAGNPGWFTVNSTKVAQGFYERLGFVAQPVAQKRNGVISVPMKLTLAGPSGA